MVVVEHLNDTDLAVVVEQSAGSMGHCIEDGYPYHVRHILEMLPISKLYQFGGGP